MGNRMQFKIERGVFRILCILITWTLCFAPVFSNASLHALEVTTSEPPLQELRQAKVELFGELPIAFELIQGQTQESTKFFARAKGYQLYLTSEETIFLLDSETTDSAIHMRLSGSSSPKTIKGLKPLPGKVNYFTGKDPSEWRTDIPLFAKVMSRQVYPGIDLLYYGHNGAFEYDFLVAPGADPSQIAISFEGADQVDLDASGNLILKKGDHQIVQHSPVIYQEIAGKRESVRGDFTIRADGTVGFRLASYNPSQSLVIDPKISYSTYLGGNGALDDFDDALSVAVDSAGSVYVTGFTRAPNFPLKNPIRTKGQVYVSKLSPDGKSLVYSTYLGSGFGTGIQVTSTKSAVVVGGTFDPNFPLKSPIQSTIKGDSDLFITKLSPAGNSLVYSTYLGGSGADEPAGVRLGIRKNIKNAVYVFGSTTSTNFPLKQPTQSKYGGGDTDGFISIINPTGKQLLFSTYYGGKDADEITSCGFNPATGDFYLSVPVVANTNFKAGSVPFDDRLSKFELLFFVLGDGQRFIQFVEDMLEEEDIDKAIASEMTGSLSDAVSDFSPFRAPNSAVAAKRLYTYLTGACVSNGGSQCFDAGVLLHLDLNLKVVGHTQVGDERGIVFGNTLATDLKGNVYVAGETTSNTLPLVQAVQGRKGSTDGVIMAFGPGGGPLIFSTYLGGTSIDRIRDMAVDRNGNIYVVGHTQSRNFPKTAGAFQRTLKGRSDAFIVKISPL